MTATPPKNSQPPKDQSFRFLDLPPELRNQIYNLTLPAEVHVRPVSPFARHVNQYQYHDALALLLTSHQIRHEARPLLFSDSTFRIHLYDAIDSRHFGAWIDGVGEGLVSRMKCVHVVVVIVTRLESWFESWLVRVDVRKGEAGAMVSCSDTGPHFLEKLCQGFKHCALEGGNEALLTCERQGAVLTGVHTGEWKGCFSITDVKTIVYAVGKCADLYGVPVADQIRLGSWD